ncbi:hypothetical protein SDRG_15428 [Saprolegnia diclina VS20]|uniref:Uncharacterized protein n=1 Tax=Saprolegnia diclina (strain VS20) TaxID=1156394 RepID=T0R408_SAPDV|nr:hypothetical protein SDRG_15428 [Saprolegnia diclina VS20]EQC26778.1 hypothetical protein SDRG_15428 [Saprolegnia diclina VS20]|eukprot:XP_008619821.1 hypothetical protein SDRG_15428 [Saprolegnia diclina VS20]
MAMKRKRVHAAAAAAMVLDVTAISLLQYLDAWDDALALLQALPAATMSAPLAATKELLATSPAAVDQWPTICIERLEAASVELAFVALPALPALEIRERTLFVDRLQGRFRDLEAFLSAHASKIVAIHECVDDQSIEDMLRILPRCSHLERLEATLDVYGALLPHLGPRVHCVRLEPGDVAPTYAAAAPLLPWLAQGRVRNLRLLRIDEADGATSFAAALATATSVTHIDLDESEAIVRALVAAGKPLYHWQEITLGHLLTSSDVAGLVALLDLGRLTRLDIFATDDMSCVLEALPHMSQLHKLSLCDGSLDAMPATLPPPSGRLARLTLRAMQLSTEAVATILRWTLQLQQLEMIHLDGMHLFDEHPELAL